MELIQRRLRNLQQSKIPIISKVPNIQELSDGEIIIAKETAKNPKLYLKIGSKVYINEFKELTKGS
tara:strand:+ start:276 stop:473 length:198 start_codon:yes stop_codon:yes gene_type:complete